MNTPARLFAIAILAACRPAPQADAVPGSTTYTRGAETVRSDTTHNTSGGDVTIALDAATHHAGGTLAFRLASHRADTLGYNACSSRTIERESAGSWSTIPEPGRMCTMELRLLLPHETQQVQTDLPDDLATGSYRMVLTLSRQSSSSGEPGVVRVASAAFRVE